MKKLAFAALLIGASALTACGGGGDDDDDGVSVVDAGPTATQCDPVEQTGCAETEKCGQLSVTDTLAMTTCVPNGDRALGEACETGASGQDTGFDNCESTAEQGLQCLNGQCREICATSPDTCGDGFSCSSFENLFDDVTSASLGVCSEVCNPVTQDCAVEGEGCFLDLNDLEGQATCVGIVLESMDLGQGEECFGPTPQDCYLNGCDEGFAPVPVDVPPPGGRSLCTAYCTPVDTYIDDPDGDGMAGTPVGNAEGLAGQDPAEDCNAARIGLGGHQCRFFQALLDQNNNELDYVPAEYGFCLDVTGDNLNTYGDCSMTNYVLEFRAFDGLDDPTMTGPAAVDAYCTANPGACGSLCTSLETLTAIGDAYCAANPDGMLCATTRSTRAENMRRIYLGKVSASSLGAINR